MATQTSNLNLTKPAESEAYSVPIVNANMDKIDEFAGNMPTQMANKDLALGSGLAIICNGDTHEFIPAGAYIYVYNNTHGLADGLYYNSSGSGRAANSQVTSSMCTAVSGGGLNALNSNITNLNNNTPKRQVGAISPGQSATIALNSNFSVNTEFALVALNYSGNALGGSALIFLGRGTGKYKDLIGSMSSANYTFAYSNNTWTITNNSAESTLFYTVIVSI